MAVTLFLSPRRLHHPPPSIAPNFPHQSSHLIPTSVSPNPVFFNNPKLIPHSKPFKSVSFSSTPYDTETAASSPDDGKSTIQSTTSDCSFLAEPSLGFDAGIKLPTAPWMKSSLIFHPNQVSEVSKPRKKRSTNGEREQTDQSLTDKIRGGRGKKAMKKVFQGIGKLRETRDSDETQENLEDPELEFSLGELGEGAKPKLGEKMPWERDEGNVFRRIKKHKVATAAELSLDSELLERLRGEAARMRRWLMVKKAGVTQAVLDQIRLIWKDNELAMLKFDIPLSRNMDRAQEIVETKTRGLVVWRKKDALVVYRGCNYKVGLRTFSKTHSSIAEGEETSCLNLNHHKLRDNISLSRVYSDESTGEEKVNRKGGEMLEIPINASLYEREADRLLDGLGPRFFDWWRPKPLPVDADLLPEAVPGFKPPFRLCPPHANVKLTDDELTYLRKLAHPLPTHFVLGRNRKLQGLAAAILKLWEKCHIVKIAVKWGVQNTNNAQMAYELKCLTGGILLLRNKFYIIFYRGNDFLPGGVANLVAEREMELRKCQLQEEAARLDAIGTFYLPDESYVSTIPSGSLSEFGNIQAEHANVRIGNGEVEVQLEAEKGRLNQQLRLQEQKLSILKMKIQRSAKELAKLHSACRPAEQDADQELITQEERQCFRKIGLKMDTVLVLGRRGVFDGVIEGLHQHWKHREIAKVITMQRLVSQVSYTAKQLEIESGGTLVSVDKLKEGHGIIIYRGKNYNRPVNEVPPNLLNKREALRRSLEMQRIGSLKFFAHQRQQTISKLKFKLADLEKRRGTDQRGI